MELVVDSNCLISALIRDGKSRELICSANLRLFAPDNLIIEISKHKKEILQRSGISEEDFSMLLMVLLSCVRVIPEVEFKSCKERAKKLVTHPEDIPFIALALAKQIPLWTNDKGLRKQSVIRTFSTSELLNLLGKA